ncbi:sugar phosphate isomerase/epimerase [Candidatus Bathyarchaeota archaeon]|nr:sugar phosphate isomerase/epimerase [Candidatus Bathyarchaeota archaeon]
MRVGLSTLFCINKPLKSALRDISHLNIEHLELVDEGMHELDGRKIDVIRRFVRDEGLSVSVHAPFADINIASTSPSIRNAIMRRLKKSMRLSAKLCPEYWIFHSGVRSAVSDILPELDWKINLDSIRILLREARKYSLKISVENTPRTFPFLIRCAEDLERLYEQLGDDGLELGVTLDVGHANIGGELDKMIRLFHRRIVHTHLHDNNGDRDSHLGIGFGKINWPKLILDLRSVGYNGALVVESINNVNESISLLRKLIGR